MQLGVTFYIQFLTATSLRAFDEFANERPPSQMEFFYTPTCSSSTRSDCGERYIFLSRRGINTCSHQGKCAENEECCLEVCIRKKICLEPHPTFIPKRKDGIQNPKYFCPSSRVCPSASHKSTSTFYDYQKCSRSYDCYSEQICCFDSCFNEKYCTVPVKRSFDHIGECPAESRYCVIADYKPAPFCRTDQDCFLDSKCCYQPCTRQTHCTQIFPHKKYVDPSSISSNITTRSYDQSSISRTANSRRVSISGTKNNNHSGCNFGPPLLAGTQFPKGEKGKRKFKQKNRRKSSNPCDEEFSENNARSVHANVFDMFCKNVSLLILVIILAFKRK